ncbi:hypothetical protein K438DRAFT_1774674 [Mycena galopus ATCC 62051]|nr:hypothetical protein K438DRAFT_1774674 [Mycena galopus ATCC 62051]
MSLEQLLTKYDFERFTWKPVTTPGGSQCFARPLAGVELVEDLYIRFEKGNQILFFAVSLDFDHPQSHSNIVAAARAAWISLRYRVPTLATSLEVGQDDMSMLKYRVPSADQAVEWGNRTLLVHHRPSFDLNGLREELGPMKIPTAEGDLANMHLVIGASDGAAPISHIGFIFHAHHAITDGNGCKIIVNQYLTDFGNRLAGGENVPISDLPWGTEVDNLTPAIFNVLSSSEPIPIHPSSEEEPTLAHPMYATLAGEMQAIGASLQNQHGFKPRDGDSGWPKAQRVELIFSPQESETLLGFMKKEPYTLTVLGAKFSIEPSAVRLIVDIAHAALAMVAIADNPVSKDSENLCLNNFCMFDVRPRLKAPYTGKGYNGLALSPPMLNLPVSLFLTAEKNPLPLDRALLVKLMSELRNRYAAHQRRAIAYTAQGSDILVYGMKQGYAVNHIPVNQCYMFSSDGRGETYLTPVFHDGDGNTLFTLTKFFTSLSHPQPAPYFRLSSWNGIVDIGADFNGNLLSAEEAAAYLAKWKEFMFLILN